MVQSLDMRAQEVFGSAIMSQLNQPLPTNTTLQARVDWELTSGSWMEHGQPAFN